MHLPVRDGIFDKVYAHHVLEHFSYSDADIVLMEIHRILRPEGVLDLIVPNFLSFTVGLAWIFQKISSPPNGLEMALPMLSGEQDYPRNVHKSLWHVKLLKIYLEREGFSVFALHGQFRTRLVPSIFKERATVIQLYCRKTEISRRRLSRPRPFVGLEKVEVQNADAT